MRIRPAIKSDKEEVLNFCVNTFRWGDYIDRVWDYWYKSGQLLVVEDGIRRIGMSHLATCPDSISVWLEGVRVHPDYRRSGIATKLITKMIKYGRQKGARQAFAIVDVTNVVSQRMMEKNGFAVVSRWAYYSAGGRPRRNKSGARLATIDELDDIRKYLQHSKIYSLSAKRYMKSWHWYALDEKALRDLAKEQHVVVTGRPIDGVVIINRHGYWDRTNILQIVYLDAGSAGPLRHLVSFVINTYLDGRFEGLQLVCHDNKRLTSFIEKFMIKEDEQFLLYNKVFTADPTSAQ
ncbi:MAG TPA: GNAT family N-acetyltransferase [Nitrososphaera sp.]|nr:GNAT family N-acetyltransferase [Nitrososphaera sp.]